MKIATFNVNGIRARLPLLLRWLEAQSPAIACLQELKAPQEQFPAAALEDAGYGAVWHGQKGWNGVAILARGCQPVERRRALAGDPEDVQSRYLEAEVAGLVVGCLYLPNGNPAPGPKFDYKLRWMKRLAAHARDLLDSRVPAVLAGDFNVIPAEQDVYAPERWVDDALFRPEVRAAYRDLLAQGWTDTLRTLHPDERMYTFWKYLRNAFARDAGLRIDHILLSPAASPRLRSAGVDRDVRGWDRTSDHAPAWVTLEAGGHARGSGRRPFPICLLHRRPARYRHKKTAARPVSRPGGPRFGEARSKRRASKIFTDCAQAYNCGGPETVASQWLGCMA